MKLPQEQLQLVDDVVREAAESLARSFRSYWPTFGDTGAHERNLSLHVGSAFLNREFLVYGEGHSGGGADERFDLLAYSPSERMFVAAEFKQLWSRGKALEMRKDVERLRRFRPVRRTPALLGVQRIGLVAALSEDDARFRQVLSGDSSGNHAEAAQLVSAVPAGNAWNEALLVRNHGRNPDRPGTFHLLWTRFLAEDGQAP